jgi:hypothetical protein
MRDLEIFRGLKMTIQAYKVIVMDVSKRLAVSFLSVMKEKNFFGYNERKSTVADHFDTVVH